MPVITVSRAALFARLEKQYTDEEFYDLCFEFGIELDAVEGEGDQTNYKIEIPANRYDLLCLEGLSQALRLFLGRDTALPNYRLEGPPLLTIEVDASVSPLRPYIVAAVLRGVSFTDRSYQSFIDLQEKLHQNICRKRSLVSVGTHDLERLSLGAGPAPLPLRYTAVPPTSVRFVPLRQTAEVDLAGMVELLEADPHLRAYLPLIRHAPRYPVVLDAAGVCSAPPVINSERTKLSVGTRAVLIEATATDRAKALTVLDTLAALFAQYAAKPFAVEPVRIRYPDGTEHVTPDWTPRVLDVPLSYLESAIGVPLVRAEVPRYLQRMSLRAELLPRPDLAGGALVRVHVPPTRSDVLHACDVMEDVAIGFGFSQVLAAARMPGTVTAGAQQPLNKLSDQVRGALAEAGYTEVLTLSLCSHDENYAYLQRPDDAAAVRLANPKTAEYQVARTSLLPGLLKTLAHNRQNPVPIRLFEVSDVVTLTPPQPEPGAGAGAGAGAVGAGDVGAVNRRFLGALHCDTGAGFEHIHGLLDRVLLLLEVAPQDYRLEHDADPAFLPGRSGAVWVRGRRAGQVGVVHPHVLAAFDVPFPCSVLLLDLHTFL